MKIFDIYHVIPYTDEETLIGQIFATNMCDARHKAIIIFPREKYQFLRIISREYVQMCETIKSWNPLEV